MEDCAKYKDIMESAWLDYKNEMRERGELSFRSNRSIYEHEIVFKYFYIMRRSGFDAAIEFVLPHCKSGLVDTRHLLPPRCLLDEKQCTFFCPYCNPDTPCDKIMLKLWSREEKIFRPVVPTDW